MMSFWNLSSGEAAQSAGNSYGKEVVVDFGPIPAYSFIRAFVEKVEWRHHRRDDPTSAKYINIQWRVTEPEQYAKRVIFQELWVDGPMPWLMENRGIEAARKKKDEDLTALAVIDANAGGKLATKADGNFTDDHLMIALKDKSMVVRVGVKKKPRQDGTIENFINAIRPIGHEVRIEKPRNQPASKSSGNNGWVNDDWSQPTQPASPKPAAPAQGGWGGDNWGSPTPQDRMNANTALDDSDIPF